MQTSYRFTGQRREADLGLYDYGARFYDPALGRFIQADTIVPPESKRVALTPLQVGAFESGFVVQVAMENQEIARYGFPFQRDARTLSRTKAHWGPSDPQLLNRYSYVSNNPLRYVDWTGHFRLTPRQLNLLYQFARSVVNDWAVTGTAGVLDSLIAGIGGAVLAELGPATDILNEMFSFLPGALCRKGYEAIYEVLLQAVTACGWAGESPAIDMLIFHEHGYWVVHITVCGNGQCHSYESRPISDSAMEGMLPGPSGYGFLDALMDLGIDWEYAEVGSHIIYSDWEWWYNRRSYNPDPTQGYW